MYEGRGSKKSPCTHEMVENHTWVRSKRCIKKVTRRFGGLLPPKFKLALSFAPFSYFRGANSISRLCPCQDKAPGSGTRINHRIKDQDRLQSLPFCHPVTLSYNKIISCHLVIVTSCHLFIMTSCHLVIVASCHLVISDSKIVVLTQTEPRAAF